jgi:Raf kinase inhibitor-like YbhB/YbcL family protein
MTKRTLTRILAAAMAAAALAPAAIGAQAPATLTVTSTAFKDGETIPVDYTGFGKNVSPPLAWTGAPAATRDPDANFGGRGPFVHWVIYKIPATATGLPEGVPSGAAVTAPGLTGAVNGVNGFAAFQRAGQPPVEPGYRGPMPPAGAPHHYRFTVYALNAPLDAKEGLDKAALLKAMEGKIAAQGELIGLYQRQ